VHRIFIPTILNGMTYQITPVEFKNGVPENEVICEFIESNSSQTVSIQNGGFPGQFSIFFKAYPDDVLEFRKSENDIVIYGDFGAAPALSEIFYSALVSLGGDQRYEEDLVQFPVSDDFIKNKNIQVRSCIRKFTSKLWGVIILALVGICGILTLIIGWAINA
jgi:hypothetical protein